MGPINQAEMSCKEKSEYWTANCCVRSDSHPDLEHENLGSEQDDHQS